MMRIIVALICILLITDAAKKTKKNTKNTKNTGSHSKVKEAEDRVRSLTEMYKSQDVVPLTDFNYSRFIIAPPR